ncbi:MAG TPA: dihydroorotase [bacterium]
MKILIKNGHVVDPANGIEGKRDLLVVDGIISRIAETGSLNSKGAETVNAKGLLVLPGFIDLHSHLREPGYEYKETIETGGKSAVAGGFTSICCMANTSPVNDNASVTRYIMDKQKKAGFANVFPVGAITKGLKGSELSEIGGMVKAGIVAISDDAEPVMNSLVMRRAMEYSKIFGIPLFSHCEDLSLGDEGVMNEGIISTLLGLKGMTSESEFNMIQRDINLACLTGARLHISHVSTASGVSAIREAKKRGIKVTSEVTPHHLMLTEDAVRGYGTNFKMKPPLRTKQDVESLEEGLADGTIDSFATDHAPHAIVDKQVEFDRASFGIVGFETAFPLLLTLVKRRVITLNKLIEKLTVSPAGIIRKNKGTLSCGADADIVLADPDREYTIDVKKFYSKGTNSPFDGWKVKGSIERVFVSGRLVFSRGG